MFPLREDNEIKKIEGGIVFCRSKTQQYPKYGKSFVEKQPYTIQPLNLMRQRYIAPARTRPQEFG